MSTDDGAGFVRLDTPRKCIDWMKKEFEYDEKLARQALSLPSKEAASKKFIPGGPFVSTEDKELDALLFATTVIDTTKAVAVDAELEVAVAGESWWHWREAVRFDRTHTKRPRIKPAFVGLHCADSLGHFVHCSRLEPEKIIYTPDIERGRRDVRVLTTVGKYLTKHYARLGEAKIKAIAEEHNALYKNPAVFFALGADEIEEAYERGPTSCMMSAGKWKELPELPVRLYDSPDVAVAYLKNASGKISARCLIDMHETPMTFSRVYGDGALLTARLTRLGFTSKNGLSGARLRKVIDATQRMYVCPYVDWVKHVEVVADFYIINGGGSGEKRACQNTSGYLGGDKILLSQIPKELLEQAKKTFQCSSCKVTRTQPHGHEVSIASFPVCTGCLETRYVLAVADLSGTLRYVNKNDAIQIAGTWYNTQNERLRTQHGIVYSAQTAKYYLATECHRIKYSSDWVPMADAVQLVCGKYGIRTDVRVDPDGRFIDTDDAGYLYADDGVTRLYYHPEYLPTGIVYRNGRYRLATKEIA